MLADEQTGIGAPGISIAVVDLAEAARERQPLLEIERAA
jgi:hypothetical protein